jgi:ubiquitin-conjugating enzyme E2 G1
MNLNIKRLQSEFKQISKDKNYFYSISPSSDNFFEWNFLLIGPPDTIFEGGIFKGKLNFPKDYPNRPPKLKFITEMFHPNIYKSGLVCISILHEGVDEFGYESVSDRWTPTQSINSIMMSVLSMLPDPNLESPANVDAAIMCEKNYDNYKKKIYKIVSDSQK